ncbi:ABC transporter permease [Clostridium cylindrosporum]|uniref:FtsX-like permease family n=1 Tax=Clostridium cylindrosporum DSM 605 TaxID=1121307 RepID=A0A0J8DDS5_CLOCY|nr:ABC transporter permease [Clostridium cylindrosporum]KMT22389.1 FtsX-like permease family [Clostridium cylindrosporum DSM 605]
MYIFKNAIRNILRSKGRNFLIGIIACVIAISSCISLSIKKSASKVETEGLKSLSVTAQISLDRQSLMKKAEKDGTDMREMMSNYKNLPLNQLEKYAKSKNVNDFYYTLTSSVNTSGTLKAVDTSDSSNEVKDEQSSLSSKMNNAPRFEGGMGKQGDFSVIGYSSKSAMTDFKSGASKLTSGQMFSEDASDMKCLVSDELTALNSLKVGDKITIANPNTASETYTLTIAGIYHNNQSSSDDSPMRFSTSSDPANHIYTSYSTLKFITTLSTKNATTSTDSETGKTITTALREQVSGTYVVKDVNALNAFTKDAKTMGLAGYYTVNSKDVSNYEQSLVPIKNLSKFADVFLILVLLIGGIILVVLNIFNIRERKYEVGVLTAIGMKKWKVAIQYISEMFLVTFIAIIIGTGIGAAASVPTANTLLQSQITSQQTQVQQERSNFGSGQMADRPSNFQTNRDSKQVVNYINNINANTDIDVVLQLVGIGVILTIISSLAAIVFILRYEPLKILTNRS